MFCLITTEIQTFALIVGEVDTRKGTVEVKANKGQFGKKQNSKSAPFGPASSLVYINGGQVREKFVPFWTR